MTRIFGLEESLIFYVIKIIVKEKEFVGEIGYCSGKVEV